MIRKNQFHLSAGIVELSFPMPMTAEDVQDFKDAMAITFRILERTATNGQRPEGETTSADNIEHLAQLRNQRTNCQGV